MKFLSVAVTLKRRMCIPVLPGGYKSHGHVLVWYNQAPAWMTQIIPENLGMAWNAEAIQEVGYFLNSPNTPRFRHSGLIIFIATTVVPLWMY